MFSKNDNQANERIIYQAKPNLILGCKKAILGVILLAFVLSVSGKIIQFVGEMQVYLISQISLPLTRYTAIGVFVLILVIVVYIIWQIVGWYAKDYILTDSKIIIKSGVLLTRKNYMPYATIQDINTSQSIFARLFNVGSISVYSAYDNNQMSLENISNPSKVEEIIFSKMTQSMNRFAYNRKPNYLYRDMPLQDYDEDYYDDVSITPIAHEQAYGRRQYEYYPEDLSYDAGQRPRYEYEPYDESLEDSINRAMNTPQYGQNDNYYNQVRQDYSYSSDDEYYDETESYYDNQPSQDSSPRQDTQEESSEKIIRRHFDKFKR